MSKNTWPRILHISTARGWRGSERQLASLLEELKHHEWPATILCRKHSPMRRFCHRHRIDSLPYRKRGFKNLLLGWEIYKLSKKNAFDLVHVHDPRALSAAIIARRLGMRLPLVVSCRIDKPEKDAWLSKRKYSHPSIKAIICPSEAGRTYLSEGLRRKDLLHVIHKGIDIRRYEKLDIPYGRLRREYFVPDDFILVGKVAALAPQKDLKSFLKAASILLEQNPKMFFLIIGEGPERSRIEALIDKMGLKEQVKITGSRKDIPEVLPQLDILVNTSLNEGLGTTILDAFAAGVPVATTNPGGIPEMVEHRQTGMLSPVKDAGKLAENVMMLLSDPHLKEKIIAGARERLKQYDRSTTAKKIMQLYLDVLGRKALNHEDL